MVVAMSFCATRIQLVCIYSDSCCLTPLTFPPGSILSVTPVNGGFNDCFYLCDFNPGCMGWTYVEDNNGKNCYLKDASGGVSPTFTGRISNVIPIFVLITYKFANEISGYLCPAI